MNEEDIVDSKPEPFKCQKGHLLESDKNYFCRVCNQAYYPSHEWNFYKGFDSVRDKSIINNYKNHFIYKEDDGTLLERNKALEKIIEHSCKRDMNKKITLE